MVTVTHLFLFNIFT